MFTIIIVIATVITNIILTMKNGHSQHTFTALHKCIRYVSVAASQASHNNATQSQPPTRIHAATPINFLCHG